MSALLPLLPVLAQWEPQDLSQGPWGLSIHPKCSTQTIFRGALGRLYPLELALPHQFLNTKHSCLGSAGPAPFLCPLHPPLPLRPPTPCGCVKLLQPNFPPHLLLCFFA